MTSVPLPLDADVDPFAATETPRAALDRTGIVLAPLAVDPATPSLRLIDLDRARAPVAVRLAHALQRREPTP
ncbi:hypothetical protein ACFWM5_01360 [Streptomyces bobili]|uniref:hypothetical protein n=1 Tax=Streptomyces bobili TaxID=67280 RepID=UPI00365FC876